MLEVVQLVCERGDRPLFSGLSFRLEPGALLRIAGPNGSGKTTLLRILCGLRQPDAGHVHWQGRNVTTQRESFHVQLAYIGHANALKDGLLARECVQLSAAIVGTTITTDQACDALVQLGLGHIADLPVQLLSAGQRRLVSLARLANSTATLWILDEPFTALDSTAARKIAHLLTTHVATGGMLVYTSHEDIPIPARRSETVHLGQVP